MDVDQLLEMPGDSFESLQDITTHGVGDFHMMTAEIELHEAPPKFDLFSRHAGSSTFSFVGRRDLHALAIFGNGAPGHRYAFLRQNLRHLAVAARIFRVLLGN